MEQKTLFLVKGRPGHINPTLPDATLYLSALTEESLDLQGSSGTYHMLFDFFFFFYEAPVVWQSLRSLGINLLPVGFSREGACWYFLSHDTYRQIH